jgi:hypothetical protein
MSSPRRFRTLDLETWPALDLNVPSHPSCHAKPRPVRHRFSRRRPCCLCSAVVPSGEGRSSGGPRLLGASVHIAADCIRRSIPCEADSVPSWCFPRPHRRVSTSCFCFGGDWTGSSLIHCWECAPRTYSSRCTRREGSRPNRDTAEGKKSHTPTQPFSSAWYLRFLRFRDSRPHDHCAQTRDPGPEEIHGGRAALWY